MTTPYHAKYFAYELSRRGASGLDRIGQALFDASVDLNPHQIEAALFAIRSPLSKGALIADEVGLGKTIEAGLALCQYWAEKKRNALVICPASLRKQWALELSEKFHLPVTIIDAKKYRQLERQGRANPFKDKSVIICSMHYAKRQSRNIREIPWDLIIIDEAHKLRNAYRPSNKMGQEIRWATDGKRTLLLTATPLQNSLLELYGLSTLVDESLFGDVTSFRTQYMRAGYDLGDLRDRIQSFSHRTLRKEVLEYIRFTERRLITRPFAPTEQEHELYLAISAYLQRENNYALPSGQRHLIILLVRKVLASSPHAVAGTLKKLQDRLIRMKEQNELINEPIDRLLVAEDNDEELLDEILEDYEEMQAFEEGDEKEAETSEEQIDTLRLQNEIDEIGNYIRWAYSIGIDTKTKALLKALEIGFDEMNKNNAKQKAVVFTESIRTQYYLKDFLEANGYAGQVLTFNGTNRDTDSADIYSRWFNENKESGRISGSKQIDIRTAIIDSFSKDKSILIATEAAAEGINLQFCSLVINFDLPWNPQRIEQRIGRCHRYGQKHDVVVINFLNERNQADQRVYELLESKFNLFSGVFGASDEVLGTLESGMDFERRVLDLYQQCRNQQEIQEAFDKLQLELEDQIQAKLQDTRRQILEHFDEDVHDRLKLNMSGAQEFLDRISRMYWALTKFMLSEVAEFNDQDYSFKLLQSPLPDATQGRYKLISKSEDNYSGEFLYRLGHPLGLYVQEQAKQLDCPSASVSFDITNHPSRITVIEQLQGYSGWLKMQHLTIDTFDREEYILVSGFDDNGKSLDQETCEKMFNCDGTVEHPQAPPEGISERLKAECERHVFATITRNLEENNKHFNEARDKLDKWADDMVVSAEKELDDVKRQIRDLQRQSRRAPTLQEQHELQGTIVKLEKKKRDLRKKIFNVEDDIYEKRDKLVKALEKRMKQKTTVTDLFAIRWNVI